MIDEQAWDLSIATNGGWFWFTWAALVMYVVLFGIGYPLAVKGATGAAWPRTMAIGIVAFMVFQVFEFILIR